MNIVKTKQLFRQMLAKFLSNFIDLYRHEGQYQSN